MRSKGQLPFALASLGLITISLVGNVRFDSGNRTTLAPKSGVVISNRIAGTETTQLAERFEGERKSRLLQAGACTHEFQLVLVIAPVGDDQRFVVDDVPIVDVSTTQADIALRVGGFGYRSQAQSNHCKT